LDAALQASYVARQTLTMRMNPFTDGENGKECIVAVTEPMFLEEEDIDSINVLIHSLLHN
jgi:hypothetical protein